MTTKAKSGAVRPTVNKGSKSAKDKPAKKEKVLVASAGSFTNDRDQKFLMFQIAPEGADSRFPDVNLSLGKCKKLVQFLPQLKAFVASEGTKVE